MPMIRPPVVPTAKACTATETVTTPICAIASIAAAWLSEHYGMPIILMGLLIGLALNFAAMDLSEFYASLVPTLPNVNALQAGSGAADRPAMEGGDDR